MGSLIDQALVFAARAHASQQRKTDDLPYIAHPVGVAFLLLQMGCPETVVAAGLLHDTVEDSSVTLEEIRGRFGPEVADLVAFCTEPKKSVSWESRKTHLVRALRDAPLEAKLVAAADKYHNLSHTLALQCQIGPPVWERFGRGPEQQAWFYRAALESLLANVAQPERYPIFDQLAAVIEELFADMPSRPPDWSGD